MISQKYSIGLPGALLTSKLKKQINPSRKKILIFLEMELSGSSIKWSLIFSDILGNRNPPKKIFIFKETKNLKSFLYLGKLGFSVQARKTKKRLPRGNLLYSNIIFFKNIFSKESCFYISGNKTLKKFPIFF